MPGPGTKHFVLYEKVQEINHCVQCSESMGQSVTA